MAAAAAVLRNAIRGAADIPRAARPNILVSQAGPGVMHGRIDAAMTAIASS
jgi:hypothetical protein